MLKGGGEEVARADGDTDGQGAFGGAPGGIAFDGEAGIDADAGKECTRVLTACGKRDYQTQLGKELAAIGNSEMWQAGKAVRALRPKEAAKAIAAGTKGVAGRAAN